MKGRLGEREQAVEAQQTDPPSTKPTENRASASRPPAVADGEVNVQVSFFL